MEPQVEQLEVVLVKLVSITVDRQPIILTQVMVVSATVNLLPRILYHYMRTVWKEMKCVELSSLQLTAACLESQPLQGIVRHPHHFAKHQGFLRLFSRPILDLASNRLRF